MTELDAQLRAGMTALAERDHPAAEPDQVVARLRAGAISTGSTGRARRPNRRRATFLVAAAVLAAAVVAAGMVAVAGRGGRSVQVGPGRSPTISTSTSSMPTTTANDPFPAGLHEWGSGPPGGATYPTPIWDGHQVIVLGGDLTATSDGDRVVAFDPATGRWRTLPSLPFSPGPPEEETVSGGACGGHVLAWGQDGQFAELAPDQTSWTTLPTAPDSADDALGAPAWCFGDQVLFPGSGKGYSFTTGTWHTLAVRPGTTLASTTWTGREMVLVGTGTGASRAATTTIYDPATDTERAAALAPIEAVGQTVAWTGSRVIETNVLGQAASYDPATDRWTRLSSVPSSLVDPSAMVSDLQVVDGSAYVLAGRAMARLDADGRWTVLGSSVLPAAFESGGLAVVGRTLINVAAGTHGRGLQTFTLPAH